jgi:ADP-ribosylglycohydrolase
LEAVNLGSDTDTTAAITGGLAGLLYQDIPQEWIDQLQKKQTLFQIIKMFERRFDCYKDHSEFNIPDYIKKLKNEH